MTDKEALVFYNSYKRRLFNSSIRILKDPMDAEEVVQDTILKYLSKEEASPMHLSAEQCGAWLHRTCIRASIDVLRKRATYRNFKERYKEFSESDPDVIQEDVSSMNFSEFSDRERKMFLESIREKMMDLSDGYRTVLSLILFEGYDYNEVASILGITLSTVRSQFLRGKRKLLENIENDFRQKNEVK